MKNLADLARGVSTGPRGQDFTRAAIALAKGGVEYAEGRWGVGSRAALVTKAAVEGMTAESTALVGAATEFFAAVGERSIIGRLSGLARVPLNVRLLGVTGGTAHWVGPGQAKPVTSLAYTQQILTPSKIIALAVVTEELLNHADVAAEATIRAQLLRAVVQKLDETFIDPDNAGETDGENTVKPASVTNGVTPVSATADPMEDLRDLVGAFDGDLDAAYLVMPPVLAAGMAGAALLNIGARGGNALGIPVVTSRYVPAGVIALIDPGGIAYGEGAGEVGASRHGTVEMSDAPLMAIGGGGSPSAPVHANTVSLWQTNSIALIAGRAVNWGRAREGSVGVITGADYSAGSP